MSISNIINTHGDVIIDVWLHTLSRHMLLASQRKTKIVFFAYTSLKTLDQNVHLQQQLLRILDTWSKSKEYYPILKNSLVPETNL